MARKMIALKITTESPVLLTAGPPAHNLVETLDYIPGNTVRGLLANHYLSQPGKAPDDLFKHLFINGEVFFGPALIDGGEVIPLSARTCKYEGGFENDEAHGVWDLLRSNKEDIPRCAQCQKPLDYHKGYFDPVNQRSLDVRKRRITRTAIAPQRGTASTGLMYSQQVIEEGQAFIALIDCPGSRLSALEPLLNARFQARIGTGKSRGQGWVHVERTERPSRNWGNAADRYARFEKDNGTPSLAVTLLTDALFTDDYLRDLTAPTIAHLAPLGIAPEQWQLAPSAGYADTRRIMGFDGAPVRLPRIPRLAVSAGSVFLFSLKPTCGTPDIPGGEGGGWIGDNQREGFGRAVLWHPFHYGL